MFISDFAIRRPIITIVVTVALVAFGLFALTQLEVDEFPDIQSPIVTVMVLYPGASPEEVEREVIDPVEEAIAGIDGVDRIESVSADGIGQVLTLFLFTKGVQEASQDVRDALSEIRGDLPPEIEEPVISRFDPADMPIVSLTLSSTTLTQGQLTTLVDPDILRELRAIPGVASADMIGGAERELTVELRPADLYAAGVSVDDVVTALEAQNLAVPVGRVEGRTDERTIRLAGRLTTPEQFEQLVVTERGGRTIRLRQVATARDGTEEPRSAALYNGRQAIGINILKTKGTSTTTVADEVKKRAEEIGATLPEGAQLNIVQDAGERVEASVRNVQHMLIEGAFLTIVVVLVFLNSWRSTVITGLTLPISVLSSFIAVWVFDFTLNTMSLLGISLAIGVLIDDAIVVRENIVRHIQMGKSHYQAAHDGTDEIGLAVVATTTTIIAVFVPIALISGEAGQWFKPMAATTASAVLVSLFVSFSLDPMMSAYWPDPQLQNGGQRRGWNVIARAMDWFNRWFDHMADRYRGVIAWALDHRIIIVGVAIASLVVAIALQVLFGGFGFVPISDRGELNIAVETPPGSNLDYTRTKAETIARLIRARDEVEYTYVTVGEGTGLGVGAVDRANIYVRLTPRHDREISQYDFAALLRTELRTIGGATAFVYSSGFGDAEKELQFDLTGPNATMLTRLAEQLADTVRTVPNAVDVGISTRGQKPELTVDIDRGAAGRLGVTVAQISRALRPAFAGVDAGDWIDPDGETRDVEVRLTPQSRRRAQDIRLLPLLLPGAVPDSAPPIIPLAQVARVEDTRGPAQIDHLDRERVVTIGANVQGRSLGEITQDVRARLDAFQLPPGYAFTSGGQVQQQERVFNQIFAALAFALLLMYLVLVAQFSSFVDPIGIMLSLPLSLIGVVIALLVTNTTLNIMSLIGVMLLMGIVAKNAILLIDFAKWGRERGLTRRQALIEAGHIRLRPIIMTSLSLIAGMAPVALGLGEGADFRAPLGRAVIGGTITSTLLTLLVIPTVYDILDEWKERLTMKVLGRKPHIGHAAGGGELAHEPGD